VAILLKDNCGRMDLGRMLRNLTADWFFSKRKNAAMIFAI
jgi:hypothetical protein